MIGLIIAILFFGTIGAIVYGLYTIWLKIKPYTTFIFKAFKQLCEIVITIEGAIQGPLMLVINTIGSLVGTIGSSIGSLSGVVGNIGSAVGSIQGLLGKIPGVGGGGGGIPGIPGICDKRIKENIIDADINDILSKINRLEFKNYNYIDDYYYQGKTVSGLIANQVKEIIPEAVTLIKYYLPNIMKNAKLITIVDQKVIINLDYKIESNIIKISDIIKLVINNEMNVFVKVLEVADNNITVDIWYNADVTQKVFMYGPEVNDFHSLDVGYLGILALGGIQQLYKEIQELKNKNEKLRLKMP